MEARSAPRAAAEDAFLDAAERLLVEVGYAGITTRRLAEEAGANHGLVHYYFGSMENLLVRVLERFTDRLIERQREMYAQDVPVHREVAAGDALPRRRGPAVPEDLARAAGARLEPARAPRAASPTSTREWRAVLTEAFEQARARATAIDDAARRARLARDDVQPGHHARASCPASTTATRELLDWIEEVAR